jgi:TonB C terminal
MRTLTGAMTLALLLSAAASYAQTPNTAYRYVDEQGVVHWAQSLHLVPPAYVSKAATPNFTDPIFPTPPPYVTPATVTTLALTIDDQPRLESVHGRYAADLRRLLTAAWKGRGQEGAQPVLTFYVERDGRLSLPEVEHTSGDVIYDFRARDTIINLRRLPPLPKDFPKGRLLVHVRFALVK